MKSLKNVLILILISIISASASADIYINICDKGLVGLAIARQLTTNGPAEVTCDKVSADAISSLRYLYIGSANKLVIPANSFLGLNLPNLKQVRVHTDFYSEITIFDNAFAGLSSVTDLEVGPGPLTSLTAKTFAGLKSLQRLGLEFNFSSIPVNAFSELPVLEKLFLAGNKLNSVSDGAFSGMGQLKVLDLRWNQLATIPSKAFSGLSSLEELYLDHNQLTSVPEAAFANLKSLKALKLDHNNITSISDNAFVGLTSLESLNLELNSVSSISTNALSGLTSLFKIDFYNNHITAISSHAFSQLIALKYLNLSYNPIEKISRSDIGISQEVYVIGKSVEP